MTGLKSIDIPRNHKKEIMNCIDDYVFAGGRIIWNETEIPKLQSLIKSLLGITNTEFTNIIVHGRPDNLRDLIKSKIALDNNEQIDEICYVLTKAGYVNE